MEDISRSRELSLVSRSLSSVIMRLSKGAEQDEVVGAAASSALSLGRVVLLTVAG